MISYSDSTAPELLVTGSILSTLQQRATSCHVPLMVVGATARDLLIRHIVGSPPERATADIDIAVAVDSWDDFTNLTTGLAPARGGIHTFTVDGVEIDVIPFRGIESPGRTITWPDDHVMNVLGFQEALAHAIAVQLPGGATVHVASLPAQAILKVLAWHDRHLANRRDAIDLRTILLSYSQGPYLEQLYTDHADTLARYDHDPDPAGAHRLGTESRALLAPDALTCIHDLLHDPHLFNALIADTGVTIPPPRELLQAYRTGLTTP